MYESLRFEGGGFGSAGVLISCSDVAIIQNVFPIFITNAHTNRSLPALVCEYSTHLIVRGVDAPDGIYMRADMKCEANRGGARQFERTYRVAVALRGGSVVGDVYKYREIHTSISAGRSRRSQDPMESSKFTVERQRRRTAASTHSAPAASTADAAPVTSTMCLTIWSSWVVRAC
jgi:hypothetical protein